MRFKYLTRTEVARRLPLFGPSATGVTCGRAWRKAPARGAACNNTEFYASGKRHNESDCRLDPVARQRAHEPGLLQLLESGEN